MPYASKAQQRLFHSKNSPVSKEKVKEFDSATDFSHLPDRKKVQRNPKRGKK